MGFENIFARISDRILDFAYNKDIFVRILDSRQNFNGRLVNKFKIVTDRGICLPLFTPLLFQSPLPMSTTPPTPSSLYEHKLTHMPNYIMGISLGQTWSYISHDACQQALPGVRGDEMRKVTPHEILTFPDSPSPNPRSPRKACSQTKWANIEIICPCYSSGALSIVLSRWVIMIVFALFNTNTIYKATIKLPFNLINKYMPTLKY